MTKDEMLRCSNDVADSFRKHIQGAVDDLVEYFGSCGFVNGMSCEYEVYKMYSTLCDITTMFDKITKRVDKKILNRQDGDVTMPDETKKFLDVYKEQLSGLSVYNDNDTSSNDKSREESKIVKRFKRFPKASDII